MKLQYTSKYRLIKRFLSVPFIFALLFITHTLFAFHRTWAFILRGGEYINYDAPDETESILEIYKELKEQRKKN
jgi:hypothetical protein